MNGDRPAVRRNCREAALAPDLPFAVFASDWFVIARGERVELTTRLSTKVQDESHLTAIAALTGQPRGRKSAARFALVTEAYQARIASSGVTLEFRHVSAHKGVATPRNAVNTWCDSKCRKLMRIARKAALSEGVLIRSLSMRVRPTCVVPRDIAQAFTTEAQRH
jgi:hypothetical protein